MGSGTSVGAFSFSEPATRADAGYGPSVTSKCKVAS
jgi:hypothetical protein